MPTVIFFSKKKYCFLMKTG